MLALDAQPSIAQRCLHRPRLERPLLRTFLTVGAATEKDRDLPPAGPAITTRVRRFDSCAVPPTQARPAWRLHLGGTPGALVPVFGFPGMRKNVRDGMLSPVEFERQQILDAEGV